MTKRGRSAVHQANTNSGIGTPQGGQAGGSPAPAVPDVHGLLRQGQLMQSCCTLRESQCMPESEKDYHNRVKHIMDTHTENGSQRQLMIDALLRAA